MDLGNGHRWREQPNGTWCRFSNRPTNCTVLIQELGHQAPGTVVAFAARKSSLRDLYFSWAENRAGAKVEVALLRSRGTPDYPEGTYVVVVGGADEFVYPGDKSEQWIMIAHSHQAHRYSPAMHESLRRRHAVELARNIRPDAGRIQNGSIPRRRTARGARWNMD